ncbi:putative myeloid leukemia factor [Rosa chinensis]|uniref:Putative myeloid leukemia factor n=1 Tax=Rosa chinensis TaxID=74649 RepID=A0A2P6P7X9_ROSCH|nr:uncharacterized protein LOC112176720 [Rosa chinensis]PRQ18035.1 putative myeloid leukemia factor [Rosa chinensis]
MQGGRGGGPGGRGPFDFNDPFAGFGGFGGQGSLMSNVFGGRDPFDDPFFTRPFGGIFDSGFPGMGGGMFPGRGSGMFPGIGGAMFPGIGGSMFPGMGPGMNGDIFSDMRPTGFIENHDQAPERQKSRGPIIEELDSDHEEEEANNEKKENPRKRLGPSNDPYVEHPDDVVEEKKSKHLQSRDNYSQFGAMQSQPQAHSYTFQSSSVTYGGGNGAYYTSSKTRRMGSDGVAFEESKEADTSSGKATHRVSKGLHNKGHSITRKLKEGKVDTMQTLHNLNEDELSGFEHAWKGAAQKHMPGLNDQFASYESLGAGGSRHGQSGQGGWALPSNDLLQNSGNMIADAQGKAVPSRSQQSGNMRVDGTNSSRRRAKD